MDRIKTFCFRGKPNALWHWMEPERNGSLNETIEAQNLTGAIEAMNQRLLERRRKKEELLGSDSRTKGVMLKIDAARCSIFEILPDGSRISIHDPKSSSE